MDASNGKSSSEWRFTARSFLDKLKYILIHNIMTDLTIRLVNDGITDMEFNVHSFLFVIGSEVFEKMLNSTFKEGVSRVIEIKDVEPETFKVLIKYFYGQPLDLKNFKNLKKVQDLADIADYYMIHGLKDEIAEYFESVDTPQAACLGLNVAEKLNAPKLKDIKLQYIVNHAKEVVEQEEFLSLRKEDISLILEQDTLAIKEFDLFKAVEAWIRLNVDNYGKQIIDSLIPKVRYLSMTSKELTLGPAKSNLIKPEELTALFCNLIVNDSMPFPSGFSQIKRKCYNSYDFEFHFETTVEANHPCEMFGVFGIEVTKDIIIEGFHIFTLNGNPTECYDEDILIIGGYYDDKWPIVGKFKGKTNHASRVFVQLDENLKLFKGRIYYIYVKAIRKGTRKKVDFSKPLNVGDIRCPFTFIKNPIYSYYSYAMSIKLQTFEGQYVK